MSLPTLPTDDALVTGDAVVLDLRLAQLPTRAMAISIDIGLQLTMLAVVGGVIAAAPSSIDDAALQATSLVLVVAVILGYPVAVETLTRGRTLGKLAFGLRVVRDDGGPERFRQALLRGLTEVVEVWLTFGVIAVFASLLSSRGKRVGDVFAGTVVVRERVPHQGGTVASMPPALIPWAVTADLGRIPDGLALEARALIARWHDLDVVTRHRMAVALATAIGRHVSPPSPPGTPAEAYLNAVLAERRRRDQLRLTPTGPSPGWAPAPAAAKWAPAHATPAPTPAPASTQRSFAPASPSNSPSPSAPTTPSAPSVDTNNGFALPG